MSAHLVRLDRLLGRCVLAANNRSIGRIEEFRAEARAAGWVVTAYSIGSAGLWERLGLAVRRLSGSRGGRHGYVARWDQLDLSNPDVPRLRCRVEELERL
ncbi:MAG: hypothetical protein JWL71_131 [Acidobacteria bacterium]|nr:hypothetical protein [Acidobacteriota bacterium]